MSDEDISPDVVRVIPELRDLVGDSVGGEDLGDLPAVLIVHLLVAVPGQVQRLEICNGLQVAAELSKEGYLMTNCQNQTMYYNENFKLSNSMEILTHRDLFDNQNFTS